MGNTSKSNEPLATDEVSSETESWIFSLTPIGVAFVFYIMFIISTDIESKGPFIAYGAAAGFIGLETYWIIRGWRKNNNGTVLMGAIGIAITLGLLGLYLSLV